MFESKCQFSNWERKCFDSFFSSLFSFRNWHGPSLKCHWNECFTAKYFRLTKKIVWPTLIYMTISLFKNPAKEKAHFIITVYIFWFVTSCFLSLFPDLCLKFQNLNPPRFGSKRNTLSIYSPIAVSGKSMLHWITNFSSNGIPKGIKSLVHYLYLIDVLNSSCRYFTLPSLIAYQLNQTLFLS